MDFAARDRSEKLGGKKSRRILVRTQINQAEKNIFGKKIFGKVRKMAAVHPLPIPLRAATSFSMANTDLRSINHFFKENYIGKVI